MSFTIRYAIPMKQQSCATNVAAKLNSYDEIESVDIDLPNQEAVIKGSLPPSDIVKIMQSVGRDAFVRGSGLPNSNAVCILEDTDGKVHGLARLIEISENKVLIDTVIDAKYGNSEVAVYSLGDISNIPSSLGKKLRTVTTLNGSADEANQVQHMLTVDDVSISELIGRSLYVSSNLVGIIARSAGLWENDKTVCACTGKSMWEERKDARQANDGIF
ncbi:copper chaperone [Starmerella bacillaris]|uniref:Superoxide dismutase 1 copper chaperone n=1 Tax=Starmerella bacillaris TaxID=1247836 RepID=A0AAV5RNX4_STABA|nr:copper chaperone [Starmerella bacillaris]